ncbi:hypothetical protein CKO31_05615 [Thiohalocapsa halophila]|uniref:Uncharacterized protein n=1 Tax=Thiohalocapsa halophila TaxID=69359 RepID=A0ABS1CEB6_9GAMM|nr:hypothetical protein [Thiohalocapsa halophila]
MDDHAVMAGTGARMPTDSMSSVVLMLRTLSSTSRRRPYRALSMPLGVSFGQRQVVTRILPPAGELAHRQGVGHLGVLLRAHPVRALRLGPDAERVLVAEGLDHHSGRLGR